MNGSRLDPKAIERLLRPHSVAIVGASATPGALGASVLANLERLGFRGDIHLINPNRSGIAGRACLKSIDDLPLAIDVAVLAIPRAGVLAAMAALARRKIGAAVIFSSGFAESDEGGRAEQREIARIAAEHDMVIEGPNCLGLVNHVDGVALTFVETPAIPLGERPGIGIVSQSGAMACVLGTILAGRKVGVSYSISTGNEAASGVEDYLEHLLDDSHTQAIGLIVEQFRRPQHFLDIARRARRRGKSLVLLHPGRSSAARRSAATHTGALAGDHALMRAKVEAESVILVETLEELGDVLEIIVRSPRPVRGGAAVMAESGAFKALTLDLCEQVGLALPELTDASAPELRSAMPPFVAVSNPLDLTAQGLVDPDIYRRTLLALSSDERFGAILLCIIQTDSATAERKFPPVMAALRQLKSDKLVVFAGLDEGARVPAEFIDELRALGVAYFPSPERAIRAVARLAATAAIAPLTEPVAAERNGPPLPAGVIPEHRAKSLLKPLGIPFPAGLLVRTLEEALRTADSLGYPVALKAQSVELSHKSDAGGVVLRLSDGDGLAAGWQQLHANIARARPGLVLDGVLVEVMSPPGVELIIGGRNDPDWGPVVLAGFGGVQAELLQDVRLILPGRSRRSIIEELCRLQCGALLRGYRGSPALDLEALADLIVRLGQVLSHIASIREIDLNPVIAYPLGQGVIALDALIVAQ
ncbi:MAG TPA: acetate--CoA ligase family protein [Steroidobacteraceae bacterium]|jgi:acyl-CoA synthetase (NDP forming)